MTDNSDRAILRDFLEQVGRAIEHASAELRAGLPPNNAGFKATLPAIAGSFTGSVTSTTVMAVTAKATAFDATVRTTTVHSGLVQRVIDIVSGTAKTFGECLIGGVAGNSLDEILELAKMAFRHLNT